MKQTTKVKQMYILDGGDFLYETGMLKYGAVNSRNRKYNMKRRSYETDDQG